MILGEKTHCRRPRDPAQWRPCSCPLAANGLIECRQRLAGMNADQSPEPRAPVPMAAAVAAVAATHTPVPTAAARSPCGHAAVPAPAAAGRRPRTLLRRVSPITGCGACGGHEPAMSRMAMNTTMPVPTTQPMLITRHRPGNAGSMSSSALRAARVLHGCHGNPATGHRRNTMVAVSMLRTAKTAAPATGEAVTVATTAAVAAAGTLAAVHMASVRRRVVESSGWCGGLCSGGSMRSAPFGTRTSFHRPAVGHPRNTMAAESTLKATARTVP